jgi:hypothetical protein
MPIELARYRAALQEFTGVASDAFTGETLEFVVGRDQPVAVTLNGLTGTAQVIAPLDHTAKSLPKSRDHPDDDWRDADRHRLQPGE